MKNIIIFGAGFYGQSAYFKLLQYGTIIYYVDSNSKLWGTKLNGVEIISLLKLSEIYDTEQMDIYICCRPFMDIFQTLKSYGIETCYAMVEGFLYYLDECSTPFPTTLQKLNPYKKRTVDEKNILYVQNTACIRTHKIASVMKSQGWKVFLLYTMTPPAYSNQSYEHIYDGIFTAFTAAEITEFVNDSEFDLVHSSNEPDILTSILVGTNKKIVFDTHDLMSMKGHTGIEELTLEYIATTRSNGLIHVTDGCLDFVKRKYPVSTKPILCLGNYPQHQYKVEKCLPKLSLTDGEIHCVYEGGMVLNDASHARFFKEIWKRLTDEKIHIHFYTNANELLCRQYESTSPFLHYEGNKGTIELIQEMTQYDGGLVIFNINDANRAIYENSSPNKIFEYLNAGLPVISGNLESYNQFLSTYQVGLSIDFKENIMEQINKALEIKIDKNFLNRNKLTMESQAKEICTFYEMVLRKDR